MTKKKKLYGAGSIVGLGFIGLFCATMFLNHSGFCYQEMRYLAQQELMDRALFGFEAGAMSLKDKKHAMKNRSSPTGAGEIEYPNCCRVTSKYPYLDKFGPDTNKFFGWYVYSFTVYYPMTSAITDRHPYEYSETALSSCGFKVRGTALTMDISKDSYFNALKRNETYHKGLFALVSYHFNQENSP